MTDSSHRFSRFVSGAILTVGILALLFGPIGVNITNGISFEVPVAHAQSNVNLSGVGFGVECGDVQFFTNFGKCASIAVFNVLLYPSVLLLILASMMFDWILNISISSATYAGVDFITEGWRIVRDISNLVFLFALIWVAIKYVIGSMGAGDKKMLPTIIVMAILVNFSLFTTKVVIDSSNILAKTFMDSVEPAKGTINVLGKDYTNPGIAMVLMTRINPQNFLRDEIMSSEQVVRAGENKVYVQVFIGIAFSVASIAIAISFFQVSFLLLGRIIQLWISMILSPFAFASITIGKLKAMPELGFDGWMKNLLGTAFVAPIFLFFLYLIALFFQKDIFTAKSLVGKSLYSSILETALPIIVVLFLIKKGTSLSRDYSSSIATGASDFIKKGTTMVAGGTVALTAGGAAMGLRRGGGAIGAIVQKRGAQATLDGKGYGRVLERFGQGLKTNSFDVRNSKVTQKLGGYVKGATGIDIGTPTEKRSYISVVEDKEKAQKARINEEKKRGEAEAIKEAQQEVTDAKKDMYYLENNDEIRTKRDEIEGLEEERKDLREDLKEFEEQIENKKAIEARKEITRTQRELDQATQYINELVNTGASTKKISEARAEKAKKQLSHNASLATEATLVASGTDVTAINNQHKTLKTQVETSEKEIQQKKTDLNGFTPTGHNQSYQQSKRDMAKSIKDAEMKLSRDRKDYTENFAQEVEESYGSISQGLNALYKKMGRVGPTMERATDFINPNEQDRATRMRTADDIRNL